MPSKTQSILLGGLVAGILGTSYLGFINLICCLGVVLGALAAVWHYTSENSLTIPTGQGAAIGAGAAIVGMIISTALNYLLKLIGVGGVESMMADFMSRFASPEQLEQFEQAQEQGASAAMMAINMVVGAVVSAIFGAIGGAIGAAVFKKGGDLSEETPDVI